MANLQMIYRYPVKGFAGERLESVALKAGEGLPDDRRYAITNGIYDTRDGEWLTCRSFFINAVNDGLLKFANESDSDTITLVSPNGMRLSWRKGDAASLELANRQLAEFVAPLAGDDSLPLPQIAERNQLPGMLSGYWDFTDSAVSIMNIASMETVAKAAGRELDPRRLRGNLYLSGLGAWEEFGLLGKRIRIGKKGPELEILRPAQRCPATSVNPETGDRDFRVPDTLTEHFGHAYCGMYAKVVKDGEAREGASVEIIGNARTPLSIAANPQDTPYERWPKFAEIINAAPSSFEASLRSAPQDEGSGAAATKGAPADSPHPEVRDQAQTDRASKGGGGKLLTLRSSGPWPLPDAKPGQRMRFHIAQNLIGVATISECNDGTVMLLVEPSQTSDPATAYLLEKTNKGDRFIVTGPFGRG